MLAAEGAESEPPLDRNALEPATGTPMKDVCVAHLLEPAHERCVLAWMRCRRTSGLGRQQHTAVFSAKSHGASSAAQQPT